MGKILVFGGSGSIGSSIAATAAKQGWDVFATSRKPQTSPESPWNWITLAPSAVSGDAHGLPSILAAGAPYDAVCWAHGMNSADSVYDVQPENNLEMYRTNCLFILQTLKALLSSNLLSAGARLCIISSIWQNIARQNKLSYCMTKAALQGLVLSASADLARDGYLINAVLPGALDTPMTRANLAPAQLQNLMSATAFQRLAALDDVASLVLYLCSPDNRGITGQFIAADLGYSNVRLV